ncbi:hypothetical protein ERO13_D13G084820v2 [Gossypium hirsutum]|uniref:Uncharacterized protein n=5 Tax=Gossypium TaxID=3633 RepID=A0A0D2W321_GOSRA|nr:hypothetical protein ES319_D13G094800v1 [Gossypium barbadense]KAG4111054.1 hypothetical protein ERO13_D13G084820v2 [Gossypium hirsutum]KJB79470.1 hypothetical protein B456_013G051700 [Gossypium raimondii]TYG36903.1 hypothetical protein ES288_D13G100400v1 [Gossypium darwinii]TYH34038.1 hypothetical protein ES332_D13G101200v1 [Gossypium tomentosum]TYI46300.1 hypothetical protein E1A91_D13G097700v1 [Gossypium mustelinum]
MFGSCCSPSLKPSLTLFFENSARCGVMVVKFGCMQSAAKFPAIKFFISPIKSYLLLQVLGATDYYCPTFKVKFIILNILLLTNV